MKEEIEEIISHVEKTWLANDGGLTAAASDVISLARATIRAIERNDVDWVEGLDPFAASTGAEQDIIIAALEWARQYAQKLRRQIEDRLRKDKKFFEKVVDLYLQ